MSQAAQNREVISLHLDDLDEQIILPEQLHLGLAGVAAVEGERRLILAVFEDALQAFRKYAGASDARGQMLFGEAEEWFLAGDAGAVLSFEYVSEALGLDAELVRAQLRRWRERSRHRRARSGLAAVPSRPQGGAPPRLKKASGE